MAELAWFIVGCFTGILIGGVIVILVFDLDE
jgi:hypothetical protein